MDERELGEAWTAVAAFVEERTKLMSRGTERTEYFEFIALYLGRDPRTLSRWLAEGIPSSALKSQAVVTGLTKLYGYVSKAERGNWRIASTLAEALKLKGVDFWPLENYRGDYKVFRRGNHGLIVGDIEIKNTDQDPWMHYHTSIQDGIEYNHQGPVFLANGRIYILGIGANSAEKYFRPMIFRAEDHPHTSTTFGILLTELAERKVPISAKVALVSKKDPRINQQAFLDKLSGDLKITSEINLIHGPGAN